MHFPGDDSSRINSGLPDRMRPGQENFDTAATSQEFSFGDLLDTLNPLQHIPVVSAIYRELTGDQIAAAPKAMGGVLYGGPAGIVGVAANAIAQAESGKDLGGLALAAVTGGDEAARPSSAARQLTEGASPAGAQAAAAGAAAQPPAGPDGTAHAAAARPGDSGAGDGGAGDGGAGDSGAPALTGIAALQAFARDVGAAKGAAAADAAQAASESAPAPAKQARQTAAAADAAPARDSRTLQRNQTAGAPSDFMPLTERPVITGTRARTSWAALAAQSDPLGSRRLQGDPSGAPAGPATASPGAQGRPADRPAEAAGTPEPAARTQTPEPPAAAAGPAGTRAEAGAASAAQAATQGDLAERMMRALDKYEAMHRRRGN